MRFHEPPRNRQPQSQSCELPRRARLALLKCVEQARKNLRIDPLAGVDHIDPHAAAGRVARADGDGSLFVREFLRVVDQIPENLLEARLVAMNEVLRRLQFHYRTHRIIALADFDRGPQHQVHVDRFKVQLQLAAHDPRVIEQVADQAALQLDVSADRGHVLAKCFGKLRMGFDQRNRQQHRRQRRAQLVREGRNEFILGSVGTLRFQPSRSLALQQLFSLALGGLAVADVPHHAQDVRLTLYRETSCPPPRRETPCRPFAGRGLRRERLRPLAAMATYLPNIGRSSG